ncbi:MAG: hypothetical protein K2X08_06815, partial [Chlamydiales bacterium]|nr:hypothetical protein [Chlamydiales bacterium]
MFYKIIYFLSALGTMDEKGWVSVERPKAEAIENSKEALADSWPVFVRQFGADRILIRFPDEPTYTYPYVEQGDLETAVVEASFEGVTYQLSVELLSMDFERFLEDKKLTIASKEDALLVAVDQVDARTVDFLYRSGKKWIRERVVLSSERFYTLQTTADTFDQAFHDRFLHSFDLETRDENKVFH